MKERKQKDKADPCEDLKTKKAEIEAEIKVFEEAATKLHHERDEALEHIGCLINTAPAEFGDAPNRPDGNEDFNAVVKKWGEIRKFDVP